MIYVEVILGDSSRGVWPAYRAGKEQGRAVGHRGSVRRELWGTDGILRTAPTRARVAGLPVRPLCFPWPSAAPGNSPSPPHSGLPAGQGAVLPPEQRYRQRETPQCRKPVP